MLDQSCSGGKPCADGGGQLESQEHGATGGVPIASVDMVQVLDEPLAACGIADNLGADARVRQNDGPRSTSCVLDEWAWCSGMTPDFIRLGMPPPGSVVTKARNARSRSDACTSTGSCRQPLRRVDGRPAGERTPGAAIRLAGQCATARFHPPNARRPYLSGDCEVGGAKVGEVIAFPRRICLGIQRMRWRESARS